MRRRPSAHRSPSLVTDRRRIHAATASRPRHTARARSPRRPRRSCCSSLRPAAVARPTSSLYCAIVGPNTTRLRCLRLGKEAGELVGAERLQRVGLEQPDDLRLRVTCSIRWWAIVTKVVKSGDGSRCARAHWSHTRGRARNGRRDCREAVVVQQQVRLESRHRSRPCPRSSSRPLPRSARGARAWPPRRATGSRTRRPGSACARAAVRPRAGAGPGSVARRATSVSDCTVESSSAQVAPRRDQRDDARRADAVDRVGDERGRGRSRARSAWRTFSVAEAVAEQVLRAVAGVIDRDAVERLEPSDVGVGNAADDVDLLVRQRVDQRIGVRIGAEHDLLHGGTADRARRRARRSRASARRRATCRRRRRAADRLVVEIGDLREHVLGHDVHQEPGEIVRRRRSVSPPPCASAPPRVSRLVEHPRRRTASGRRGP